MSGDYCQEFGRFQGFPFGGNTIKWSFTHDSIDAKKLLNTKKIILKSTAII